MPRAELSPRAGEDMREIWRYRCNTWSERQAQIYIDTLFDEMETMAMNPRRGRATEELSAGLRRQGCGSHSIFYREVADGVFVVRVLHRSMDHSAHVQDDA